MDHAVATIRHFLEAWGYWAVAAGLLLENAGIPVPGETILIIASVMSYNTHHLHLPWVILVGTVAATAGDNIGYWIGRRGGRPLLERWRHFFRVSHENITAGEELIQKYGPPAIFFARFIAGARIIAGPMAGILNMDWPRFALFNFLGAIVWVSTIATFGYMFGSQLHRLLHYLKEFNYLVLIALAIAVLVLWIRRRRAFREQ